MNQLYLKTGQKERERLIEREDKKRDD